MSWSESGDPSGISARPGEELLEGVQSFKYTDSHVAKEGVVETDVSFRVIDGCRV